MHLLILLLRQVIMIVSFRTPAGRELPMELMFPLKHPSPPPLQLAAPQHSAPPVQLLSTQTQEQVYLISGG